jgi:hypothetical protein
MGKKPERIEILKDKPKSHRNLHTGAPLIQQRIIA